MTNKVLFLDFDGPLFSDRVIGFHPDNSRPYPGAEKLNPGYTLTYWKMDEIAVSMLNKLYSIHPFDTVISSTWKTFASREFIEELFKINGLNLHLHQDWDTPRITFKRCRRIEEIIDWLDKHPDYAECIVVDDPWSGESICSYREAKTENKRIPNRNIVIVDPTIGLEVNHYSAMRRIVEVWSGKTTYEEQERNEQLRQEMLRAFIW